MQREHGRIAFPGIIIVALLASCCDRKELAMKAEVWGELIEVLASRESAFYVIAVLRFSNDSGRTVRITRYRLTWDGGAIVAMPRDFVVPPGARSERRLRVTPAYGDLRALTERKSVWVEVVEMT